MPALPPNPAHRRVAAPIDIPAPRLPPAGVPGPDRAVASDEPRIRIPSPRVPADTVGRHRSVVPPAPSAERSAPARRSAPAQPSAPAIPTPAQRALLVAGRIGSLATLASLLVLSGAVAGLLDGATPTGQAAQVATTTLH